MFFHKVHRLLEFFIFLDEGLHPFDQLVALLGSPSYPLQAHNGYDELRSPTSKMRIPVAVRTSICFITPARADFSLLISLVVSSSSTTTTSSPRLRRIQTDWGRGLARSISSTSSSSAIAGCTTWGLGRRIACPTMPSDASGSAACYPGTIAPPF